MSFEIKRLIILDRYEKTMYMDIKSKVFLENDLLKKQITSDPIIKIKYINEAKKPKVIFTKFRSGNSIGFKKDSIGLESSSLTKLGIFYSKLSNVYKENQSQDMEKMNGIISLDKPLLLEINLMSKFIGSFCFFWYHDDSSIRVPFKLSVLFFIPTLIISIISLILSLIQLGV